MKDIIHRIITLLALALLTGCLIFSIFELALITGCISENDNKSNSITVNELPYSIVDNFDFEYMQNQIEKEIHISFPNAKYSNFSFLGKCEDINAGEGIVSFSYHDEQEVLFHVEPKITELIGSYNTKDKTCEITILDMTNIHTSMVFSPKIDNLQYKQLLQTAYEKTRLYSDCQVEMLQTGEEYHLAIYEENRGYEYFNLEINHESIPTPSN